MADEDLVPPQNMGDPHGDEVLESGPPDPIVPSETPEGDTPPETPPVAGEIPPETPPETPTHKADWRDKELTRRKRRLDEETTAKQAAEAEAKRWRDIAEAAQVAPPAPEGDMPPLRPSTEPTYTRAQLQEEAKKIAAQAEFQRDFDHQYQKGVDKFGLDKMQEAIGRIRDMGGLDVDHLNMMLATDEPEKVLFMLGNEPDKYHRIMDMPFNKRVAEFVKMGLKTEQKQPTVSRTPAPVDPIGGGGGSVDNRYSDKASDADWFAAEEKRAQIAWKKRQDGWRG